MSDSARAAFVDALGFTPDRFQIEAFELLDAGEHVIVAAPTGAGKTLVASYAVDRALRKGRRLFYTTPIKALSNQKFGELVDDHGADRVGLLTGDNAINPDAPIVVMTTEVLRNMLYAGNPLSELDAVVLDEVHYLQDAYRGPVWEEVIIHLPATIQLVCLSATVSNAAELAEWMTTVRGATGLVVEHTRPVELDHHYLIAERGGRDDQHLLRTVVGGRPNPDGHRFDHDFRALRGGRGRSGRGGSKGDKKRWRTPHRLDVVRMLRKQELLPAIVFIFSRAGCSDAAKACVDGGLMLTDAEEQRRIREILEDHLGSLSDEDREVLDYETFERGCLAGIAPHHAGLIPPFKEAVERAFAEGLIKVVFATETLALGINMPARSVVIEKLSKFTGEHHEMLSPAQYTQITGRAGRRGIDTHGTAVVLWSPYITFDQIAGLAMSRDFVLRSSFRPTYNMAANLVRRYDAERARQLLNLSFAQFRSDAEVVRGEQARERLIDRRRQIAMRLEAEYGPEAELRAALAAPEATEDDRDSIAFALSRTNPGDILRLSAEDVPSPVAVLSVAFRKGGQVRARVVDHDGDVHELTPAQLVAAPVVAGELDLPEPYLPQSMVFAHEVSKILARTRLANRRPTDLRPSGVITSADDIPRPVIKQLKRLDRMDADLAKMSAGEDRGRSLAGQFDRVIGLLEEWGHLDGWELTPRGERLARLYHESDLFCVEAIEDGIFDELPPAEIAALASALVYSERRREVGRTRLPTRTLDKRMKALVRLHRELRADERRAHLPETREPDAGFMDLAHAWAAGGELAMVLDDTDITAGDFVRTARQLVDLLRQIAKLAPAAATRRSAGLAADAVMRDLVAAQSVGAEEDADDADDGSAATETDPDLPAAEVEVAP